MNGPMAEFLVPRLTSGGNSSLPGELRHLSREFKRHVKSGDVEMQQETSAGAWKVLRNLALAIRHAEDKGLVTPPTGTGQIAEKITLAEQQAMLSCAKVDRRHPHAASLGLRDCLNKVAHPDYVTFRIDGRGAHYLVIGGELGSKKWVAEFGIMKLADDCERVIEQLP